MAAGRTQYVTKSELNAFADKTDANFEAVRGDIRALGVMFERLESFMRGVAEALTLTREQLERKMDDIAVRLSARISVLEEVVRQNSVDVQTLSGAIRNGSEDIRKLQLEVAAMRSDLARREKLEQLEVRVASVEKRLGISK